MKPLISRTADGFYRLPAFIDAHVHVESSHLTPARFGRLIASQGTLAAICDPHEIANVTGEAGLTVFIREGSAAKNLEALLPAVDDTNWERFCFCTDDCSAHDLIVSGGIVNCIRKAVALGMDPERAVALATVNPARHYGLTPSDRDCVIVKDLVGFEIVRVMKDGRPLVTEDVTPDESEDPNTVHLPDLSGHAFRAPDPTDGAFDVIGVNDGPW